MTDGGKGSKPRPFSVSQDIPHDNTDTTKNEYQDVLSTEDCSIDALEEYKKQAQDLWSDSCTTPRKK